MHVKRFCLIYSSVSEGGRGYKMVSKHLLKQGETFASDSYIELKVKGNKEARKKIIIGAQP